jgi:drug/metabolite transporter (DMT)-like permease
VTASTQPSAEASPSARGELTLRSGAFAVLLAALWGGNPVAIKAGLDDAPPLRLGWMRFAIGGVVVLVWALLTRQSLRILRSEWLPLAGLGLLFSTQLAFMNIGQDRTTVGHAAVITATFPLWTGLFAHFIVPGDRYTPLRVAGTVIAYSGVVVVLSGGLDGGDVEGVTIAGDLLTLGSAMLLGARQVYLSQTSQGIAIHKLLLAQAVVGAATFLAASALFEDEPYRMTGRLAVALLYQGGVVAGFGFLGNAWLLQRYLPSRVSAVQLTTPVWGVMLGALILDETIGLELVAGGALVILGSVLSQRSTRPAAS